MRTTILILCAAALLGGCAALESITPVSQAEVAERLEAQAEYQAGAIEAAEEGRTFDSLWYSLGAAITAIGAGVGLSRKRRAPEIAKAKVEAAGGSATLPAKS